MGITLLFVVGAFIHGAIVGRYIDQRIKATRELMQVEVRRLEALIKR